MDISAEKSLLRLRARRLRTALYAAAPDAGPAIARNFLRGQIVAPGATVAGYMPARDEADPLPLLRQLRACGHAIALPRVAVSQESLRFHLWTEDAVPVVGSFGLLEAASAWTELVPQLLLVPLLAFDSRGYRLGYGGGYYDRTLRALRADSQPVAVGIGFAGQEMATLPHEAFDEPVDWIVTEETARKFVRQSGT